MESDWPKVLLKPTMRLSRLPNWSTVGGYWIQCECFRSNGTSLHHAHCQCALDTEVGNLVEPGNHKGTGQGFIGRIARSARTASIQSSSWSKTSPRVRELIHMCA